MKKTIYYSVSQFHNGKDYGDRFEGKPTFDLEEAKQELMGNYYHLSGRELSRFDLCVEGVTLDVLPGESAAEALRREIEESLCGTDADYSISLSEILANI